MAEKMPNDTLSDFAASFIAMLAVESTEPTVIKIPTDGLGEGLPPNIPILFDRKAQRIIGLGSTIDAHRQEPARRQGTAKANTLKSFIDLTQRFKDERSAIFAATAWPQPHLLAVLNYNTSEAPHWGNHRIRYEFPLTEEFNAWVKMNGEAMDQGDFAAFVEEHAAELAAPFAGEVTEYEALFKERFATPSDVLALSRHLEVFVGAKAKQGVRLQTGERTIEFSEEHQNAKGEKVEIPGVFMVSVAAFLSGDLVRIPARLRYRITSGGIKWFYQLYRWEFWLRTAVQQALHKAGTECALPTFEGAPEGPAAT